MDRKEQVKFFENFIKEKESKALAKLVKQEKEYSPYFQRGKI